MRVEARTDASTSAELEAPRWACELEAPLEAPAWLDELEAPAWGLDSDDRVARACASSSSARVAPAFPQRRMTYRAFRGAVAHELSELAGTLPRGKIRRAMRKRAARMARCGSMVRARACNSCGDFRPGSGVLGSLDARCECRTCPVCARARSAAVREWLGRALEEARARFVAKTGDEGRPWKHITMTLQRDVTSDEAHSWELLRARLRALQAGFRKVWKSWKHIPGAAALVTIEIAGTGHVHAHALVIGPSSVSKAWISRTIGEAAAHCSDSMDPFVDVQTISEQDAIGELAKYHAKVPGIGAEKWLAGHKLPAMNPKLAARWELATYSQRLRERYGSLREVPLDESPEHGDEVLLSAAEHAEADHGATCAGCGEVGATFSWRIWPDSLQGWIGYCWARGSSALAEPLKRAQAQAPPPEVAAALAGKTERRNEKIAKRDATRAWFASRMGGSA